MKSSLIHSMPGPFDSGCAATDPAALTQGQFSLLTQIIIRSVAEHCYIRSPVGDDVRALVRLGYLRVADRNGAKVLSATEAGRRRIERGAA